MITDVVSAAGLVAGYRRGRRTTPILRIDELAAPAGQLTAVIGPNGSGKSTLLRTLVGSQPALAGDILVGGEPLGRLDRLQRARLIAVVLTDRVDPGMLTVADVVLLGRYPHTDWRGNLTDEDHLAAHGAAARLGVDRFWTRPFGELSDGQRQRVLVARALAQQPAVLVLDEPTAFLDVAGRVELTLAVAELARDGLAVIVSTHDLDLALSHADRVWLVANGSVHTSSPEQLVVSGDLAKAFSDDVVEVDATTGTIRARLRGGRPIVVHGSDLDSQLVRRIVSRLGANAVDDTYDDPSVWEISCSNGGWTLRVGAASQTVTSFDELATALRQALRESGDEMSGELLGCRRRRSSPIEPPH